VSGPEVVAARSAVRDALAELAAGTPVLVGCSGGPDSLALAGAAGWVAVRQGLRAYACVVDHGLQAGSEAVAARAAEQCRRLGLVAVVERVQVGAGAGPEDAARVARRAALLRVADEVGAPVILLGHSRDDQAETVLLRLARGSGARTLAGMPRRADPWRRPLLDLPRAVLQAAAREMLDGEEPWTDPHNADPAFQRARVRAALPGLAQALGADIVPGLARTADLLRDDADALDAWAAEVAARASVASAEGVEVDLDVLGAAPRAVRTRVIRDLARAAGCPAEDLTAAHLRAVDALVADWHGQGAVSLPGRIEVRRDCGRLCLRAAQDTTGEH
jgi:tRNA(Ile)-lysidine synthase